MDDKALSVAAMRVNNPYPSPVGIHGMSLIPSIIETRSPPGLTRSYPRRFYVDHSHYLVLAPATLAALPSTRAIPDRDVFYVADPVSSIPDYSQV